MDTAVRGISWAFYFDRSTMCSEASKGATLGLENTLNSSIKSIARKQTATTMITFSNLRNKTRGFFFYLFIFMANAWCCARLPVIIIFNELKNKYTGINRL